MDLSARIRAVLELDPAADAVQFEGTWRPWSTMSTTLETIETLLPGVGTEVPVAVVLRNRPETHAAMVATLAAHRTLLTLNPNQPDSVVASDVERLRPTVVVASAIDWSRPGFAEVVRAVGACGVEVADSQPPRLVEGLERPSAGAHHPPVPGVAVQMLTSGTTGPAKRIPLRYANVEAAIESAGHYFGQEQSAPRLRKSVQILWAPMVHISGLWAAITAAAEGRRVSLMERFNVEQWVAVVREHRPRITSLPPTPMRMVMDAHVPAEALSSLQAVRAGTAPMPPQLSTAFEERYGIPVLPAYGATEFVGAVAGMTLDDHRRYGPSKRGSVGRAQPDIELRVVDQDTGAVLGTGEQGVVEVRGPQVGKEFVRTTDLAVVDEDGFIWLKGRADDVIIRGGFKVPTTAVAEALKEHPKVADAAVVGVPDERLGAVPVAAVELVPGESVTSEELKDHLRERVTPYQVPVDFKIVEHLPRTVSLKVSQPGVRALFGLP
jgi:acyl-CoA synthetase (AMP-forming)/AMP-acid ligase II